MEDAERGACRCLPSRYGLVIFVGLPPGRPSDTARARRTAADAAALLRSSYFPPAGRGSSRSRSPRWPGQWSEADRVRCFE